MRKPEFTPAKSDETMARVAISVGSVFVAWHLQIYKTVYFASGRQVRVRKTVLNRVESWVRCPGILRFPPVQSISSRHVHNQVGGKLMGITNVLSDICVAKQPVITNLFICELLANDEMTLHCLPETKAILLP